MNGSSAKLNDENDHHDESGGSPPVEEARGNIPVTTGVRRRKNRGRRRREQVARKRAENQARAAGSHRPNAGAHLAGTKAVERHPHDPHDLAEVFVQKEWRDEQGRYTLRYWRGEWWQYKSGRYETISKDEMEVLVNRAVELELEERNALDRSHRRIRATIGLVRDVIQAIKTKVRVPEDLDMPVGLGALAGQEGFLAMRNGMIRLDAAHQPIVPLTPEWFGRLSIPYDYDPGRQCPKWLAFLREMFLGDQSMMDFMQEWFGYCLTPEVKHRLFIILYGDGDNGKGVLCAMLEDLVGRENVSAVTMDAFGRQFGLASTLGKLVNISPEAEDLSVNEAMLKAYCGADKIPFTRKFLSDLHCRPTAKLVFATNRVPKLKDRSSGIWNRAVFIPCPYVVPPDKKDPDLKDKLRDELPGVLNWAIQGLERLRQRGHFEIPAVCTQASAEHRAVSDPARAFVKERLVADSAGKVTREEVHARYSVWCRAQGEEPLSPAEFGKVVRTVYTVSDKKVQVGDDRKNVYLGIRWADGKGQAEMSGVSGEVPTPVSIEGGHAPYNSGGNASRQDTQDKGWPAVGPDGKVGHLSLEGQATLERMLEKLHQAELAGLAPMVQM